MEQSLDHDQRRRREPALHFRRPAEAAGSPGATYAGPGVYRVPGDAHYKPTNGEIIYLDGGAFIQGNLDVTGTRNVQLMGPGVLSGDLWASEGLLGLPFDQWVKFAMITGDWFGGDAATVSGVTILASPGYNFFGGANNAHNVKILSRWFYSTDGHVDTVSLDRYAEPRRSAGRSGSGGGRGPRVLGRQSVRVTTGGEGDLGQRP